MSKEEQLPKNAAVKVQEISLAYKRKVPFL
jgi:hypothetical protein